ARSVRRLDVAGSGVLALALTALLLALTVEPDRGWTAPITLGLLVVSLAALVVLAVVERRATDPLLAPGTFGRRPVLMTHLAAFTWGFMSFVFYVLLPLLAQLPAELPPQAAPGSEHGFGASVTMTGLLLLPGALGAAARRRGRRVGGRPPRAARPAGHRPRGRRRGREPARRQPRHRVAGGRLLPGGRAGIRAGVGGAAPAPPRPGPGDPDGNGQRHQHRRADGGGRAGCPGRDRHRCLPPWRRRRPPRQVGVQHGLLARRSGRGRRDAGGVRYYQQSRRSLRAYFLPL